MNPQEFSTLLDQTGLKLTDEQKSTLYQAYPLFQAMITRATPPMAREIEPSIMFTPELPA